MRRACYLAGVAGAAFYNFHLTIGEGVEVIGGQRALGRPVYAETCTQYLAFTKDFLKRPDGINYICSPPYRDDSDREALWEGLANGTVSVTASDHCVLSAEQKRQGSGTFSNVPGGIWGMEYRLPYLFSEGVHRRGISINRLVAFTSTNAAQILGIYPRKGIVAPGSDADFVLVDPDREMTLSVDASFLDVDWCPYEGIQVKGVPVLTVLRGEVVAEEGRFCGQKGYGQYIKRNIDPAVLERPVL
jgi:dihydropyrimidinase